MKRNFIELTEGFPGKYGALMAQSSATFDDLPKTGPEEGAIYVFSKGNEILYAGRTKQSIRSRLRDHFYADDAPLAWRIAREETGRYATYKRGESRQALLQDPESVFALESARHGVQAMVIRFIEEPDPTPIRIGGMASYSNSPKIASSPPVTEANVLGLLP